MSTRTTKGLDWKVLLQQFKEFQTTEETAKKFCKDTEQLKKYDSKSAIVKYITEQVQECADTLYSGDTTEVIRALRRNVQDKTCRMKDAAYLPDIKVRQALANIILDNFVLAAQSTTVVATANKPQWAFGPEEIDQINNLDDLIKVIHSISDVCSDKKANPKYSQILGENYVEVAKANREYANKRKSILAEQKVERTVDVAAKLQELLASGKKSYSSKELAAILETLSK